MLKSSVWFLVFGVCLYAVAMIVIRLSITQTAYEFEAVKQEERGLREEQIRLKSMIASRLSGFKQKSEGYQDPEPHQIHRLVGEP